MSEFQELLATLRGALEKPAPAEQAVDHENRSLPVAPAARRAELGFKFIRELEAVGGHVIQVSSGSEAAERIVELAGELGAHSVALGKGAAADLDRAARDLARKGLLVITFGLISNEARPEFRARMAQCDIGVAEADYGIAASGSLAVISTETSPRSLTLLPQTSVIVLHIDRLLPDLAAVTRAIGAQTVAAHPLVFITGPSRTADIEKRIVLGVHGPRQLCVILIWPQER